MESKEGIVIAECTCERVEKTFNVKVRYKDQPYLFDVTTLLTPYWDGKRSVCVSNVRLSHAHWVSDVPLKRSEKKHIVSYIKEFFDTAKYIIV